MTLTVDALLRWDLQGLRSSGRLLRADAGAVRTIASRLVRPEHRWRGRAAAASAESRAELRERLDQLGDSLMFAGQTLAAAAAALEVAQDCALRARQYAAEHALTVQPSGEVDVPPMYADASVDAQSRALLLYADKQRVAEHAGALARAALDAAEEADAEAAAAVRDACGGLVRLSVLAAFGLPAAWSFALERAFAVATVASSISELSERNLPDAAATPTDVAAWWSTLTPAQRDRLISDYPDRIGSLDGVPAQARHTANSAVLERELALARTAAAEAQPEWFAGYTSYDGRPAARLAMLESVRRQLAADPSRRLVALDTRGAGRAAIAIGDIDSADHVAVVIPGLEQDVTHDLDNVAWNADRLKRTADAWASRVAPGQRVATVGWLGYRTPTYLSVMLQGDADRGAKQLDHYVNDIDASREAARVFDESRRGVHLTDVGHSYGSLTAGISVQHRTPVDDVVFIGSPGVATWSAQTLSVPHGHVFVGKAAGDRVATVEWFGPDPTTPTFGARVFQTDGGFDPMTGQWLLGSRGHSRYFEMGSESLRNTALVVIGRSDAVTYVR